MFIFIAVAAFVEYFKPQNLLGGKRYFFGYFGNFKYEAFSKTPSISR